MMWRQLAVFGLLLAALAAVAPRAAVAAAAAAAVAAAAAASRLATAVARYYLLERARARRWDKVAFFGDWAMVQRLTKRDGTGLPAFLHDMRRLAPPGRSFPPLVNCGISLTTGSPIVAVTSADGLREVLLDTARFGKSAHFNRLVRGWLGNGLVASEGALWHRQRKLLTPLFHRANLKSYVGQMSEEGDALCARLAAVAGDGATSLTNMPEMLAETALRVIVRAIFGARVDIERIWQLWHKNTQTARAYFIAMMMVPKIFVPLAPLVSADIKVFYASRDALIKMFLGVVDDLRSQPEKVTVDKNTPDLMARMALLKDDDGSYSIDKLLCVHEALTLSFAAQDTTSNTLAFALHLLGRDEHGKSIQQRLRDESERVLGVDGSVRDANDVDALKLHRAVIKETLRLHGPVPGVGKEVLVDTELLGQPLPAGTQLQTMYACPGLSEEHWPNALAFNPDRWFDEEATRTRHPFAMVPFSAGSRNCIGSKLAMQEAIILLQKLVSRFNVHIEAPELMQPAFVGTLQPKHMDCRLSERM